jgi:hypothetical protein
VGYFNLRGWQQLNPEIEEFICRKGNHCRVLVGMQRLPDEELRSILAISKRQQRMSQDQANQLRKAMAAEFRTQLTYGVPTNQDEVGLKQLQQQLLSKKLQVKLFLRHLLHAKLYLIYRSDKNYP